MKISFNNKVALVTGAASGIGLATAIKFAESDAHMVVMADWDHIRLSEEANRMKEKGFNVHAVQCDVSDEDQVQALVEDTISKFGSIDIAFNNAGVQNVLADTADTTREDYDRVLSINLRGIWVCMKYELRHMSKQRSGSIVNSSSLGGLIGGAGRGIYHAAKHGVLGLTKSAALEYARQGIRINAVCPGLIWTPMVEQMVISGQKQALDEMTQLIPMARNGHPDEVADTVLYLCSDKASYITGQSVSVDGGFIMR